MRKLLGTTALAAALLLPGNAALAAGPAAPVGVSQCPTGDVGIIVWTFDPRTGERIELVHACVLIVQ